ncbi:MAG: hypothetical protein QXO67_00470 [Candidatus Bathyarchaeia archaeon]
MNRAFLILFLLLPLLLPCHAVTLHVPVDYVVFSVEAEAGALHTFHLYDLYFDGIDDYVCIGRQPDGSGAPFTVYGYNEITFVEHVYAYWPNTYPQYSKFSSIGSYPAVGASTFLGPNNLQEYTNLEVFWTAYSEDIEHYTVSWFSHKNSWTNIARVFTSEREISFWINGVEAYSAHVPSTSVTILEQNPEEAPVPDYYKRFVLGAFVNFIECMKCMYGEVRVYGRALNSTEIAALASRAHASAHLLKLYLDPTYYDSSTGKYVDLSGNNNHGTPYNGVQRIPSNRTYAATLYGMYSDGKAHFLIPEKMYYFISFANGTEIVSGYADTITDVTIDYVGPVKVYFPKTLATLEYNVYPDDAGIVQHSISLTEGGAIVSLTATPAQGFTLRGWCNESQYFSFDNPYVFSIRNNFSIWAYFAPPPEQTDPSHTTALFAAIAFTIAFFIAWIIRGKPLWLLFSGFTMLVVFGLLVSSPSTGTPIAAAAIAFLAIAIIFIPFALVMIAESMVRGH